MQDDITTFMVRPFKENNYFNIPTGCRKSWLSADTLPEEEKEGSEEVDDDDDDLH